MPRSSETEGAQRAAVVSAARDWVGTKYHHRAHVKGAGVDCAWLLIEAFAAAGVIGWFDPGEYPPDWHLHKSEERYVGFIARFAAEFDGRDPATPIEPADVVVWRYGRTFSHGAIVSAWPHVIHAFAPYGGVFETPVTGSLMEGREMRAFSVWPKAERPAPSGSARPPADRERGTRDGRADR